MYFVELVHQRNETTESNIETLSESSQPVRTVTTEGPVPQAPVINAVPSSNYGIEFEGPQQPTLTVCSSSPCLNNATCLETDDGYTCVCVADSYGPHCERMYCSQYSK